MSVLIKKVGELIKITALYKAKGNGGVHGDVLYDPMTSIYRLYADLQKPRFGAEQAVHLTDPIIQMELV